MTKEELVKEIAELEEFLLGAFSTGELNLQITEKRERLSELKNKLEELENNE